MNLKILCIDIYVFVYFSMCICLCYGSTNSLVGLHSNCVIYISTVDNTHEYSYIK